MSFYFVSKSLLFSGSTSRLLSTVWGARWERKVNELLGNWYAAVMLTSDTGWGGRGKVVIKNNESKDGIPGDVHLKSCITLISSFSVYKFYILSVSLSPCLFCFF